MFSPFILIHICLFRISTTVIGPGNNQNEDENYNWKRGSVLALPALAAMMTSVTDDETSDKLNISQEAADSNYRHCGTMVEEPVFSYTVSGPSTEYNPIVENVIFNAELPYQPQQFQVKTWNSIASKNDVILVAPCSSGKMATAELCVDIMRQMTGIKDGVGLGIMPLSAIMREAIEKNSNVAFITMEGGVETGPGEETSESFEASDSLESLKTGKYKLILAHIESLDSNEGRKFLDDLEEAGKLVFIFVDEVHKNLPSQWGKESFRKEMSVVPASLRTQTVFPWVPILAMTATLAVSEVKEVQDMLCIRKNNLVVISSTPVQPQHKMCNILRPSSFYPSPSREPGTKQLLDRLILAKFEKCVVTNNFDKFPKTLIFVKHIKEGMEINDLLSYRHKNVPINNRPWAFIHSQKKIMSSEALNRGLENNLLKLIICSPTLLMGVNLSKFRICIMLGPYEMMADICQAMGRTGRREEGGRAMSVLYNCYNKTDLSRNSSPDVIKFCEFKQCLKLYTHEYFTNEVKQFGGEWCCSNCND